MRSIAISSIEHAQFAEGLHFSAFHFTSMDVISNAEVKAVLYNAGSCSCRKSVQILYYLVKVSVHRYIDGNISQVHAHKREITTLNAVITPQTNQHAMNNRIFTATFTSF